MSEEKLNKITEALQNELFIYNNNLKKKGGQNSDFFIKWRDTVVSVSATIKSLFYDLFEIWVDIYFDVNYEYIDFVSIEDKNRKILKIFYIKK